MKFLQVLLALQGRYKRNTMRPLSILFREEEVTEVSISLPDEQIEVVVASLEGRLLVPSSWP